MKTTDTELRLAYLNLEPLDLELLAGLGPILDKHAESFVAAFYRHLLSFETTRELLRDPAVKKRLLGQQRTYLLSLAHPALDRRYVAERRRIGEVHAKVGLEPRWYLGAYSLYFSLLTPLVGEAFHDDPETGARTMVALQKLLSLDAQLAMESYIQRHERELEYLNRELAREGRELGRRHQVQSAELRRTQERAQVAEELASVGTLAAGLAHEIGTPMGVIQGHAKLLEKAVTGDDAHWRLVTIQEQIARISRIIQTLLNVARPSHARRAPVALEPLLESSLSFVGEKLAQHTVVVERHFEPVPQVQGDGERLQQVFLNLLINACDAMPEGGTLSLALSPAGDDEIEVRVADSGIGIPEADLARLFEPFFTTKEAGVGHGLGLMVARRIVREHGGSIDVESQVGKGTCFRLLLPRADGARVS